MKRLFWSIILLLNMLPIGKAWQSNNADWSHLHSSITINDIVETNSCFWVASNQGLFKVDKTTSAINHYHKSNSILPDNHIQTLSMDVAGTLWIGTYDMALVIAPSNGAAWTSVDYPTLTNSLTVYSSAIAPNGDVWLGCNQGLLKYDGQSWTHKPIVASSFSNGAVWELAINSQGKIFAASNNLMSFENNQWVEYSDSSQTMAAYTDAYLCLQNDSTVWYFTDAHRAFKFDGQWQSWDYFSELPVEPYLSNFNMQIKSNGNVYYNANNNILAYYDGHQWQTDSSLYVQSGLGSIQAFSIDANGNYTAFSGNKMRHSQNGSSAADVELLTLHPFSFNSELMADRDGNMHLYNYNFGIHSVLGSTWLVTSVSIGGNPLSHYTHLAFDTENEKWFISTVNGYLTILEENAGNWIQHDSSSSAGMLPKSATIFNMVISSQNTVWILDSEENVYEYKNGTWSVQQPIAVDAYTSDFAPDAYGNIYWVERSSGGNYSLKKHDGSNVQSYAFPLNAGTLLRPVFDASGNVWTASSNGNLYRFDGSSFHTVNYGGSNIWPQQLLARGNEIYVASSNNGLFVYDGTNWANVTEANSPLSNDDIRALQFDGDGKLWIKSSIGNIIDLWDLGAPTAIEQQEQLPSFKIFPNPCTQLLNITRETTSDATLSIINAQGQRCFEVNISGNNFSQLSVEGLPAGLYWLEIKGAEGRSVQAFIKK